MSRRITPRTRTSGITYDYVQAWDASQWLSVLPYLLIFAAGTVFILFRYGSKGQKNRDAMPLSQLKVEKTTSARDKKTFADVAGADEEKEELKENRRIPEEPGEIQHTRRQNPEGCSAGRPAGHGQDPHRQGRIG